MSQEIKALVASSTWANDVLWLIVLILILIVVILSQFKNARFEKGNQSLCIDCMLVSLFSFVCMFACCMFT